MLIDGDFTHRWGLNNGRECCAIKESCTVIVFKIMVNMLGFALKLVPPGSENLKTLQALPFYKSIMGKGND
jgi:hypothetical protein